MLPLRAIGLALMGYLIELVRRSGLESKIVNSFSMDKA